MEFNQEFNGKLTQEELKRLQNSLMNEKQIREIETFLEKNKDCLTGFCDLVGDDLVPTKQFFFNIKHIGSLLDKDPQKVLNNTGVTLRGLTTARLVRLLAQNFMTSKQIFEDRNELLAFAHKKGELEYAGQFGVNPKITSEDIIPDTGIVLPKEPVIWVPNHHFKDDALATVRATQRPVTMMFGSIPLYFNTTDGVLSYLIGSILINRKSRESRNASIPKAERALDLGSDLLWCPEGVHNKTANELMLPLWKGIYKVANDKGIKVVPIAHYIFDPTQKIIPHELNPIHTVVDNPIDLTQFSEKAGLEYLRDVISTWYYIMMEKYGKMSREELIYAYQERAKCYGATDEDFKTRPITSHEIGEVYNMDLNTTVSGYDTSIEAAADCRPKDIVRPEDVFESISKLGNIENIGDALYASTLVRERKREDYQRRF